MKICVKWHLILFAIVLVGMNSATSLAAESGIGAAEQLMTDYFQALKNGEVQTLLNMLADPLLGSRKILLTQNSAYPDYLRNYYKKAHFEITSVTSTSPDLFRVTAEFEFGDDTNPVKSIFLLRKMEDRLKIFNELRDE